MWNRGGICMTFSEMKQKDVINISTGRRLGRPVDVAFNDQSCISAIIVPGPFRIGNLIRGEREDIVIPWKHIRCFGDDVILVDIADEVYG